MKIAIIGHGEVGRFMRQDIKADIVVAYDILPERSETSFEKAIYDADYIISCVTADRTESVAELAGKLMTDKQVFIDLNSAAPQTKIRASKFVTNYIEAAVMSPIRPRGIASPMLIGGEKAEEVAKIFNALGFDMTPVSKAIGQASATKLCRSIVIKGLEVLMVDCAKACEHFDVTDAVFATLVDTFPSINWHHLSENMQERVGTHGVRRSAEMVEAGHMLKEAGLNPDLTYEVARAQLRGVAPKV